MGASVHRNTVTCFLLLLVGLAVCEERRFMSQQHASQFLLRKRRANTFLEESKKGNLERECIEELCNKEEAREIFENNPETEYFYPLYLGCLGLYRPGLSGLRAPMHTGTQSDLRSCINEISDQCTPLPCNKAGYVACIDGQARFSCTCKPGWQGEKCEEDINECEEHLPINGGCSHTCVNSLGSYRCTCNSGYDLQQDKHSCQDIDECASDKNFCGTALCLNFPGTYACKCDDGYVYNISSKSCEDVDECAQNICSQTCVNTPGSYSCFCDGKIGVKLAKDMRSCEPIPVCRTLNTVKSYELLYLGELFSGKPVAYLRFGLPGVTRFAAEFDFRTYDPEGVILYADSPGNASWLLLALRDGKIEIQFKNEHGPKVTSSSRTVNDGIWHTITVEELENSISVKIAKEAVMNINSPGSLFPPNSGTLEINIYIAGLPMRNISLINPINPRLDGCIRGWNLMKRGASGVKEVIQDKESKHCFVTVERGSYFPGSGVAQFQLDYNATNNNEKLAVDVTLNIRPSAGTGVMFALVHGQTVPLAMSIVDSRVGGLQEVMVTIENAVIARLESFRLCGPRHLLVNLRVRRESVELTADSYVNVTYAGNTVLEQQLAVLDHAIKGGVDTYLGGFPDIPITATPVTAFYKGCMEVKVNGKELDLDEALSKHHDIKSHSCPQMPPMPN